MRRPLLLAACGLVLSACSLVDDGYTTVRGRVVDAGTREPVAARLEVRRNTILGGYTLANASTGTDGRFEVEFEDTPALATTSLHVDPVETAETPTQADLPFYTGASVQNIQGGDLGDIEVRAVSRLAVRTSRPLTATEALSLSVTATRAYQGVEAEVSSEVRDFPSDVVRSDVVWAGTRIVVRWQLLTLGGVPAGGGQTETTAERGRATEIVLDLP